MKTLTPKQIVDLKPCEGYDLKYIKKLFGNKESVTYLEILDTNKIPLEDIVWLFCQLTVLDKNVREQWMDIIVTRAVTNYALHCGIDTVERWAKNWLSGVDRTAEAAYATGDAAYAARDAARYAAANAAYAAAGYDDYNYTNAAYNALEAAAIAAHTAHTDADAYDAVREIEHKQQIQDLKDILQGEM
jgi:hypothetical protein